MFNRIVPRYDLMNRIMTGGRDRFWRRMVVREALRDRDPSRMHALDVATGTGDLALALRDAGVARVIGLDFSSRMLAAAANKDAASADTRRVVWVEANAMALPFGDQTFDAVTVGFGLRNMPNYSRALAEMARVLRPRGRLVCLETTLLATPILRAGFAWYLSQIVPLLGGLLSGDDDAYRYLPVSAAAFPDADTLGRMLLTAGLRRVRYRRLGAGTVALHIGERPLPD